MYFVLPPYKTPTQIAIGPLSHTHIHIQDIRCRTNIPNTLLMTFVTTILTKKRSHKKLGKKGIIFSKCISARDFPTTFRLSDEKRRGELFFPTLLRGVLVRRRRGCARDGALLRFSVGDDEDGLFSERTPRRFFPLSIVVAFVFLDVRRDDAFLEKSGRERAFGNGAVGMRRVVRCGRI